MRLDKALFVSPFGNSYGRFSRLADKQSLSQKAFLLGIFDEHYSNDSSCSVVTLCSSPMGSLMPRLYFNDRVNTRTGSR